LVRAPNWIGDAVMCLPALEALRAQYPSSETVLVAKPWVTEIFLHHPAISRQIVYDPEAEHRGVQGFWKLVHALRAEKFNAAVLFQNAFHAAWTAWWADIPVRVRYAREGRSRLLTEAAEAPPAAACGPPAPSSLPPLRRPGLLAG